MLEYSASVFLTQELAVMLTLTALGLLNSAS